MVIRVLLNYSLNVWLDYFQQVKDNFAAEYSKKILASKVICSMTNFHDFHAGFIKFDETSIAVAVSHKEVSPRGYSHGGGLTKAHSTVARSERFAKS